MSDKILAHLLILEPISQLSKESNDSNQVNNIIKGYYVKVLDTISTNIGLNWDLPFSSTAKDYTIKCKSIITQFSDPNQVLLFSVAALQLFIQSNITGPSVSLEDVRRSTLFGNDDDFSDFFKSCVKELASDGEPAFTLMSHPHLLLLSLNLLQHLKSLSSWSSHPFAKWWYSRALLIHQSVVHNPTASIHDEIINLLNKDTLENIKDSLSNNNSTTDNEDLVQKLTVRFYTELSRAQIVYGHDSLAQKYLDMAKEASHFSYVLTGINAKRTKFQRHETSQLIFLAKSNTTTTPANASKSDLPNSLELNSDLLLENPHYGQLDSAVTEEFPEVLKTLDPNNQPPLLDIDTAIILLKVSAIRNSTPHKDILVQEELLAMINRIINSPQSSVNWSLFSLALWDRSLLEADSVKTVERGTLQMQSLVEELGQSNLTYFPKSTTANPDVTSIASRLAYIHQVVPLPKWAMDTALAEKFMSLGVLKSAIEVYERLQLWGEVALCYAAVGQEEEGIRILKNHLEVNDPQDYRCISILGDLTFDPSLWEKAWEIGKYPAAKRSLGRYYYNPPKSSGIERNLDLAIKHLNDSLRVNPLNLSAWFLYGCAGLETSQWELAAEAFTRCVSIEEDDPRSWSNLATALLRLDKKQEAFNALKRAIRTATEKHDWRIWSNYIHVAADLREWNELVRGIKQIITLRSDKEGEKCLELELLEKLVQILVSEDLVQLREEEGDEGEEQQKQQHQLREVQSRANYHFQKSCIDLFVNIIPSIITADPRLWKLVARVHTWLRKPWASLEDYEKGFRIYTHSPLIESDEDVWNEAIDYCGDLVDAYRNFGPMEGKHGDGSLVCKDWKFKVRSCVRLLIGKGKNFWEDSKGWDRLQEMKTDI